MADSDAPRVNAGSQSQSTDDGDIEKDLRQESVNDFVNGGPVQEDFEQHAHQKETGQLDDGGQVDKQATQISAKPSIHSLRSIPNGGLTAWLQVLGAFVLFFNSWYVPADPCMTLQIWRQDDIHCRFSSMKP